MFSFIFTQLSGCLAIHEIPLGEFFSKTLEEKKTNLVFFFCVVSFIICMRLSHQHGLWIVFI